MRGHIDELFGQPRTADGALSRSSQATDLARTIAEVLTESVREVRRRRQATPDSNLGHRIGRATLDDLQRAPDHVSEPAHLGEINVGKVNVELYGHECIAGLYLKPDECGRVVRLRRSTWRAALEWHAVAAPCAAGTADHEADQGNR